MRQHSSEQQGVQTLEYGAGGTSQVKYSESGTFLRQDCREQVASFTVKQPVKLVASLCDHLVIEFPGGPLGSGHA